ncbi:MAG: hypothetical protein IJ460_03955 [Clostridia bacterium]|nr:hypothetical protein [Clostridia bacterium]
MENQRKPHRKDRYDGYYLQNQDAMHVIMPYLMPNRTDNEAVMKETVDMTAVLEYLDKKNADNPRYKYTMMHVIMAAIAKAIYLRPKMNYFIADYKMYERKDISFSFVAKNQMSDHAGETLLIFRLDRESQVSPVEQIHDFVCGEVFKVRSENKSNGTTDLLNVFEKIPGWVLKLVIKTLTRMNDKGRLPKFVRPFDPYASTVFLSNLGSIKLTADYHHLANWGTNSIFVIIGELGNKAFYDNDGNVTVKKALDLGITVDERIADGYYFSKTIRLVRHFLANPQLLDEPVYAPFDME